MDTHERWENVTKDGATFLKFVNVEEKRSNRPDLHAFLLLDELFPGNKDMISGASHDTIYLCIGDHETDKLTDAQIVELSQCGVFHDEDGVLSMFV